jgi:outer membrane protein assembly factor BamB
MKSYPTLRRWLSAGITIGVLAVLLVVSVKPLRSLPVGAGAAADESRANNEHVWRLFGGSLQRNMVNTFDKNVPTEWSVEEGQEMKNVKWVAQLGSRAYGGPVIAGGKIFVGTNNESPRNPQVKGDKGIVMCFRESDGKFLWQAVHDKLESGLVNDWPREGICSTPFVDGNRVYYVSNRCELVCADTEGFSNGNDGEQNEKYKSPFDADFIWRLDMMKQLDVFPHNLATSSPLVVGDLVFLLTSNGVDEGHINVPSPRAPSFIAVNKKDGKVVWQDNTPSIKIVEGQGKGDQQALLERLRDRGEKILHGQWSNATYAEINGKPQVIFPGGDGWLYGLDPASGKHIWKFDCNPKGTKYLLGGRGTRNEIIATPVVYDNKVYVGVGQDPEHGEGIGHFWCVDITKTGDLSPDLVTDDNADPPKTTPNPNSGVVWHFGGAAKGGDRDYIFGRTMSTAAIHDGLVYIGELAGFLHCLDARTGQQYWEHDQKSEVWGSAYWVDNKVFIGDETGDVFVFAHGKEKKLLAEHDMKHGVKSTPIVVNGVLYIMTETHLYAIASK